MRANNKQQQQHFHPAWQKAWTPFAFAFIVRPWIMYFVYLQAESNGIPKSRRLLSRPSTYPHTHTPSHTHVVCATT